MKQKKEHWPGSSIRRTRWHAGSQGREMIAQYGDAVQTEFLDQGICIWPNLVEFRRCNLQGSTLGVVFVVVEHRV